ncbi:hypothetical protein IAS59_000097 [Cryptococcus gattii]
MPGGLNADNWTPGIALEDFDHATSVAFISMLTIITLAERQDVFHPPHDYKVKTEGRPGPQTGSYVKGNCHRGWKKIVGDGNDD